MATLVLVLLSTLQTADIPSVAFNDPRFRAVQPAEVGFLPDSLPSGMQADQLQFWHHRIGSDDTPPLQIATASDQRVWVDANRDGSWTELNRIPQASSSHWGGTILSQAPGSRVTLWPTPDSIDILVSRDPAIGLWRLASLAQVDGRFTIDGLAIAYRLRDENSDGKFEGVDDSLMVDLNGNGEFEKLREQLPLTRFFRVQGSRFALQFDRENKTIGAQAIDATGTAQLSFEGWEELQQSPTHVHVVLQSNAGIQVVFNNMEPQVVPVGEYYVDSATLNWDGEEKWRMTFSRLEPQPKKFFRVAPNETTLIAVLGKAEVTAEIASLTYSNNFWRATVQPILMTESGLYLTRASSGRLQPTVDGMLVASMQNNESRILTTGSTQFACGTFCPILMMWKNESASHVRLSFDSGPLAGIMTKEIKVEK
jgi:hypothetical protein